MTDTVTDRNEASFVGESRSAAVRNSDRVFPRTVPPRSHAIQMASGIRCRGAVMTLHASRGLEVHSLGAGR